MTYERNSVAADELELGAEIYRLELQEARFSKEIEIRNNALEYVRVRDLWKPSVIEFCEKLIRAEIESAEIQFRLKKTREKKKEEDAKTTLPTEECGLDVPSGLTAKSPEEIRLATLERKLRELEKKTGFASPVLEQGEGRFG